MNLGTLILMSPHNALAAVALASMDRVIGIYTSIIQTRTSRRFVQNLQWLLRLRQRAVDRMSSAHASSESDSDVELDAGLLGWKTRFIERATLGGTRATTISGQGGQITSQSPLEIETVIQSLPQAVQDHVFSGDGGGPDPGTASSQSNATDYFVRDWRVPFVSF